MGVLRAALFLSAASGVGAAGWAQVPNVRVEQQNVGAGPASDQVAAPQISDRAGDPVGPSPQLSSPAERAGGVLQLTSERGGTTAGAQLSRGPRTAREPDPLSRPSEGRTGAIARVEGPDRCAAESGPDRPDVCDRVIESRAGDFSRPRAPTLSAEQRLLVDQRLREAGLVARAVNSRGMNPDEIDPDRPEGQALAATALDRAPAEQRDPRADPAAALSGLPDASAAVIEAIITNAGAQPPQ